MLGVGLVAEELSSVDVAELVVLSLGLVVETLVLVVDSPMVVEVIKSVVVRGKLVVVRPGRRAHFEA